MELVIVTYKTNIVAGKTTLWSWVVGQKHQFWGRKKYMKWVSSAKLKQKKASR